jgi:hypothetical protein
LEVSMCKWHLNNGHYFWVLGVVVVHTGLTVLK